jgi:hypothetical protein
MATRLPVRFLRRVPFGRMAKETQCFRCSHVPLRFRALALALLLLLRWLFLIRALLMLSTLK